MRAIGGDHRITWQLLQTLEISPAPAGIFVVQQTARGHKDSPIAPSSQPHRIAYCLHREQESRCYHALDGPICPHTNSSDGLSTSKGILSGLGTLAGPWHRQTEYKCRSLRC